MPYLKNRIKQNPLSKSHYISGQQALNIDDFEYEENRPKKKINKEENCSII